MTTLKLVNYSERAFAVFGETKEVKDILKALGGRFNPHLTNPDTGEREAGWIFSTKHVETVRNTLFKMEVVDQEKELPVPKKSPVIGKRPVKILDTLKKVNAKMKNNTSLSILDCALVTDGNVIFDDLETSIHLSLPSDSNISDGLLQREFLKVKEIVYNTNDTSDNFPASCGNGGALLGTITREDFTSLAKAVKFCGKDDLRPVMSSVFYGDEICATDAHRLFFCPIAGEKLSRSILIGRKVIELLGLMDFEYVQVTFIDGTLRFINNEFTIISRECDGKYPNFRAVIPVDQDKKVEIDRLELLKALETCLPFANKTTHQVELGVDGSGEVKIHTENIDHGFEKTIFVACTQSGDDITIGFNCKFLIEILKSATEDCVELCMSEPLRAGVINGRYLLMPVALNK